MAPGDDSVRFSGELIAGLADVGVATAFVSPGSRNTPLTLAALTEQRIRDISIRDERSAAFMAVGLAKASGSPAMVICTSGSAAAHYLPAIVEADQSATPLIVVTSDRPTRLRGTGAPQTMDQVDLYGRHVKAFLDAGGVEDPRRAAAHLGLIAAEPPAGPVHVNVSFDEPLVPTRRHEAPEPAEAAPQSVGSEPPTGIFDTLDGKRVMIIASGRMRDGFPAAAAALAAALDAPILADPQTPVEGPNVIHASDLLAGAHDERGRRFVLEAMAPDVIIRLGPLPTSKPLWQWMETNGIPQIHIESSRLTDPLGSATTSVGMDPLDVLAAQDPPHNATGYAAAWQELDAAATEALTSALGEIAFPNEPAVARTVADAAPDGATLWLASSRPIRDVDAFARRRDDRAVLANRGVNGIDGTISSAIGAALDGTPTVLLTGDVAALHDATALAEAVHLEVPLRIVVVNNDGGGIFEFLPQATSDVIERHDFERHWGTPHGLSLAAVARAFGVQAWRIDDREDLQTAVTAPIHGPELIEVVTSRANLVGDHERIRRAVSDALGGSDQIE